MGRNWLFSSLPPTWSLLVILTLLSGTAGASTCYPDDETQPMILVFSGMTLCACAEEHLQILWSIDPLQQEMICLNCSLGCTTEALSTQPDSGLIPEPTGSTTPQTGTVEESRLRSCRDSCDSEYTELGCACDNLCVHYGGGCQHLP